MIEDFSKDVKSISFEDNKKGIKYVITKDEITNHYIINSFTTKTIEINDITNDFYAKLEKYFDSINDKDYWPRNENEYPDLFVLWRMHKFGKNELQKNGSLKFPDNWDLLIEELKKLENYK